MAGLADTGGMKLLGDERGLKGVELGVGLLIVGILAAVAIPLMAKVGDQVERIAATAEERASLFESTLDEDRVEVAGVQLTRSADGAVCQWTESDTGKVYGVWSRGSVSLYGSFAARPKECPTAAEVEAAGFSPSF